MVESYRRNLDIIIEKCEQKKNCYEDLKSAIKSYIVCSAGKLYDQVKNNNRINRAIDKITEKVYSKILKSDEIRSEYIIEIIYDTISNELNHDKESPYKNIRRIIREYVNYLIDKYIGKRNLKYENKEISSDYINKILKSYDSDLG